MTKRVFLPPLISLAILLGICVWIIISDTLGPPRMIDGSPDDAPRNAAFIMIIISPFFYVAFTALNLIDSAFDRAVFWKSGRWSVFVLAGVGAMFGFALHSPSIDSSVWPALRSGLAATACVLLPMTISRRMFRMPERGANKL